MSKTAVVIGASRGIGRAVAKRLAGDGFAVVVSFTSNLHDAKETVAEIIESGGRAVAIQADVTREDDVERLFETSLKEFGRIDVVVNSAGIIALSPIARGDVETFDETIRINLRATFLVFAQAALHISEDGRIIAFSSSAVGKDFLSCGAYIASKAGVEGLVRVLANETRKRRVTVNAIALGPVSSEISHEGKSDEEISQISELAPIDHLTGQNEIARVVSLLAAPDGGWISGQVIPITHGAHYRSAVVGPGVGPVKVSDSSVADRPIFQARAR